MQSSADPTIYLHIKGWGVFDTVSYVVYMYVQFVSKKSKEKIVSGPAGLCSPWLIQLSILLKGGACLTHSDVVYMYVQFASKKVRRKKLIQIRLPYAVHG